MPEPAQLQAAKQLAAWGLNVLPARGKLPAIAWQKFQDERTDYLLETWFNGSREYNYWVACGPISGIAVLDIDNAAADEYWHAQIGDALDRTACVRTAKGHHYYFSIDATTPSQSWGQHDEELSFDVRSAGTGVVVPPSVHPETGTPYEWVRDPTGGFEPLPEALFGPKNASDGSGGAVVRSLLAELLNNPPSGPNSGRNDWLSRVAGHYAKQFRNTEDAYEASCRAAHALLSHPLDDDEFDKTISSIWKKESAKPERAFRVAECTYETGWLTSGGDCLMTLTKDPNDQKVLEQWSDFDIQAAGIARSGETLTYDVVLRTPRGDEQALLPGSVLGHSQRLSVWLADHGCGILAPPFELRNLGARGDRLHRYLQSQNPPEFAVVDCLGWHDGIGFVTHEGIITADGVEPPEQVRPNPLLRDRARYSYGFGPADEAVEVLREVLTFQDEVVCSVFGAWWTAALLKGQVAAQSSLFPFMALEAPSESGKSTGFFSLMLQLAGSKHGQLVPTKAALRDMAAAHRSGIVWVDDVDDPAYLMELLRAATGNEAGLSKKGEDNTAQVEVKLVAPIVISGESLSLHGQKALADRAVSLEVPSPATRRSLRDPDRPQWDDVLDLKRKHPDLTKFAGTIVQLALGHVDETTKLRELRHGGGRFGDKIAVLRVGARVLAEITGDPTHISRVDRWCETAVDVGNENALTLKLLPAALRHLDWPVRPAPAEGRWPATAVFIHGAEVWFSPGLVADWWRELNHGRVEVRTETGEALTQQARALGLGGSRHVDRKPFRLAGQRQTQVWYWRLTPDLSDLVLKRSRGEDTGGVIVEEQRALNFHASTRPDSDYDPTEDD